MPRDHLAGGQEGDLRERRERHRGFTVADLGACTRERIDAASMAWQAADAVLVVGSSLMVYSGYRIVHAAAGAGKPVAAVTLGHTRADPLLTLKVDARSSDALAFLYPASANHSD